MNSLLKIALISTITATVVVVVLKMVGHDNAVLMGGGISGGIIGALSIVLMKNKK